MIRLILSNIIDNAGQEAEVMTHFPETAAGAKLAAVGVADMVLG